MSFALFFTLISLASLQLADAHIALWHKSMFGRCGSNNQCTNTAEPAYPLQGLPFDEWWFHNYMNFPPANNEIMDLPAGETLNVEVAGNAAFTHLGQHPDAYWPGGGLKGQLNESIINDKHYWTDGPAGNLHTTGLPDVAGCAISIAYTDKAENVRPEDMVVISVQHTCPWHRDTTFDIPADLPPCPNGKCMCSWWWIHHSDGGADQNYQTAFQCNVVYPPGKPVPNTTLGKPVPPVNCANDKSKCIKGPKQPMYWKQAECNNMQEPGHLAPTYGDAYGFGQGAQNDIFKTVNKSNWTCPQSKAPGVYPNQYKRTVPLRHNQAKRRLH